MCLVLRVQEAGQGIQPRLLIRMYGRSVHCGARDVYEACNRRRTGRVKKLLRAPGADAGTAQPPAERAAEIILGLPGTG